MEANHFVYQLYILFFVSLTCLSNWIDVIHACPRLKMYNRLQFLWKNKYISLKFHWNTIVFARYTPTVIVWLKNVKKIRDFSLMWYDLDESVSRLHKSVSYSWSQDLISFNFVFSRISDQVWYLYEELKNKHISSLKLCPILSLPLFSFFHKINSIWLYHSK